MRGGKSVVHGVFLKYESMMLFFSIFEWGKLLYFFVFKTEDEHLSCSSLPLCQSSGAQSVDVAVDVSVAARDTQPRTDAAHMYRPGLQRQKADNADCVPMR